MGKPLFCHIDPANASGRFKARDIYTHQKRVDKYNKMRYDWLGGSLFLVIALIHPKIQNQGLDFPNWLGRTEIFVTNNRNDNDESD